MVRIRFLFTYFFFSDYVFRFLRISLPTIYLVNVMLIEIYPNYFAKQLIHGAWNTVQRDELPPFMLTLSLSCWISSSNLWTLASFSATIVLSCSTTLLSCWVFMDICLISCWDFWECSFCWLAVCSSTCCRWLCCFCTQKQNKNLHKFIHVETYWYLNSLSVLIFMFYTFIF